MARGDLTGAQWAVLEPLLPPERRVGRPNRDRRQVVNAIRWRVRTGSPWRDMPERYGPWETAYGIFRAWQRNGVWASVLEKLQGHTDIITWDVTTDSAVVPAPESSDPTTSVEFRAPIPRARSGGPPDPIPPADTDETGSPTAFKIDFRPADRHG